MGIAAEYGIVRPVGSESVATRVEEDIAEIRAWQAGHEGRNAALWEGQDRFNTKCEDRHATLDRRVASLEKRVLLLAFGGGTIGAALGNLLPLTKLFGG
jgi:hypothetical protein